MPKITYTNAAGLVQATGSGIFLNTIGTTIAAAGSAIGDATAVSTDGSIVAVTGGDGSTGVVLAAGTAGEVKIIVNTAGAALKVYPASGEKINNGSASAAITLAANKSAFLLFTGSTYGWLTVDAG